LSDGDPKKVDKYWYYRKGYKGYILNPFYCDKKEIDDIRKGQERCTHDYLVVFNVPTKSCDEYSYELRNNEIIRSMYGLDDILLNKMAREMSTRGIVVKWCWKCGLKKEGYDEKESD